MPATLTALFPSDPDATYDMDYYVKHHMPLVQRTIGKHGMSSWTATRFGPGVDGSEPRYTFGSVAYWDSLASIKAAFAAPEVTEVMGDVANFSNKQPVFLIGETL